MDYSRLGSSGLVVSKLAFGAMTLGDAWGALAGPTGADADAAVQVALDAGINLFDTADAYHFGESETLLGKALGKRRHEAVIVTKMGMRLPRTPLLDAGLSARHILYSIDASLARLGTDYVDVYMCHRPDFRVPLEETLAALDAVVRAGKARYIAFSNWPAWLAATAVEMQKANGWARFIGGQMYYSLLVRDIEADYVPMAQHHGLGTMVWSPLSQGVLSGKYSRADPSGDGGRLSRMDLVPVDLERAFAIVDVLEPIARARDVPVAAVALAWLLQRPTVASIILGFSKRAQLEDNLKAIDLALSSEEAGALDAVSERPLGYPHGVIKTFCNDRIDAI